MGCDEYGLLMSRYVDDDLGGEELDRLLGHLAACAGCREELRQLERLCSWFKAADALDSAPEAMEGFRLDVLLEREQRDREVTSRVGWGQAAGHGKRDETGRSRGRRKEGVRPAALSDAIRMFLFGSRWRYAFPLIGMAVLAVWLFGEPSVDRVDVRQLTPLRSLAVQDLTRTGAKGDNMDLYVIQHASNQPWTHYGDEFPVILQASTSSVP